MMRFKGEVLIMFLRKLEVAIDDVERMPADAPLSANEVLILNDKLTANTEAFKDMSLPRTCAQLELFHLQTVRPSKDGLITILHNLRHFLQVDLSEDDLLRLDPDDSDRFEGPDLFGPDVAAVFRDANYDIGEARSCYAVGRYTACVAHAMRALEVGLQFLATKVGVTCDGDVWGIILQKIESAIAGIRETGKKGSEKTAKLQFLSISAKEFFYFKDAWRNHVMHGQSRYDRSGAFTVLQHVEAFMTHLANEISE